MILRKQRNETVEHGDICEIMVYYILLCKWINNSGQLFYSKGLKYDFHIISSVDIIIDTLNTILCLLITCLLELFNTSL
jgi:arsenate reductase-like glutaredoxin family protein